MPKKKDTEEFDADSFIDENSEEEKPQPKQDEKSVKELELTDLPGVGPAAAEKLKENGFLSVMSIAVATPSQIALATGIGDKICRKIISAAREAFNMGFDSAMEVLQKRKNVHKIPLNCESFDNLIDGGFESGAITEIYAQWGAGKTQVAHLLAVNTIKMFPNSYVVYIDTENTFRPERIKQFAKGQGVDEDIVLNHIKVAKIHNTDHQMLMAEKVEDLITKDKLDVKLIIVDSLMAHFRSEFCGRGTLADRQQKLNKHMHVLSKIASINNLVVYVTNQVMSKPDSFFGDPTAAIGGNILGHACCAIDSIVLTKKGFKKIKDVEIGDKIYNGDKFVKVLFKGDIENKECLEIRSNNFITCSYDHKFPVNTKNKDKKAKDLNLSDELITTKKINVKEIDLKIKHKTIPLVVMNKELKQYMELSKLNDNIVKKTGITKRQIRRVINQSYPTNYESLREIIKFYLNRNINDKDFCFKITQKHKNPVFPKIITKEILRIYGAWLCDGDKKDKKSIRIRKDNKEYLDYLGKIVKKEFKLNYSITKIKDKNCFQLNINSVDFVKILQEIDLNKVVLMREDDILEFCASLFDGDGSIYKNHLTFSQVNFDFITKIQMILYRLGIQSKITRTKMKGFNYLKQIEKYCYNLYVCDKNKEKIFSRMKNTGKTSKITTTKNTKQKTTHKIKEINKVKKQDVIDITVEGNYFLCNGIKTHNSTFRIYLRRGAKDSRVAKLVDSPNLPDGECSFMVEEGGFKSL